VFGHRFFQSGDGGAGALGLLPGKFAEVRSDEGGDDREDAAVLLGDGFGVDFRHPRRVEVLARLREQRRDFLHARGGGGDALGQGCELACHEAIDRPAGQVVVHLRVPGPVLHDFGIPEARLQRVAQDRGIDLVLARELAGRDRGKLGQQRAIGVQRVLAAGGGQVVQRGVEAMVAGLGGAHRR